MLSSSEFLEDSLWLCLQSLQQRETHLRLILFLKFQTKTKKYSSPKRPKFKCSHLKIKKQLKSGNGGISKHPTLPKVS